MGVKGAGAGQEFVNHLHFQYLGVRLKNSFSLSGRSSFPRIVFFFINTVNKQIKTLTVRFSA